MRFMGMTKSQRDIMFHIQSYWLVYRSGVLQSKSFWNYWNSYVKYVLEFLYDRAGLKGQSVYEYGR